MHQWCTVGHLFHLKHLHRLERQLAQLKQGDEAREDTLRRLPVDELLSHVHEMVEGGNPTELILALKALPLDEF